MDVSKNLKYKEGRFWIHDKQVKCVILCAGEGKRFFPLSIQMPKTMARMNGKPVLGYVIDYWKKYTDDFVLVVNYKKDTIIDYVSKLPINSQFVEQRELKGIADAILHAENIVSDYFIVVLGDCICNGTFDFQENMKQGIGIWKTDNAEYIKRNYSVKVKGNLICNVKEKPDVVTNNLCGMGFYFFHRKVFDYIKLAKPSKLRNEIEITDVIQNMIDAGEIVTPVFFHGEYLNINYPEDMQKIKVLTDP